MRKRAHIIYGGHVQGVGFRFTAEYIARDLYLTGWARNLPDGKVEIACEGDESGIKTFLTRLEEKMKAHISDMNVDWREYKGEFSDFSIKLY